MSVDESVVSPPGAEVDQALIQLFAEGRMQDLLAHSAELVARHPDYAFGWKAHGLALMAQQRAREALPSLRRALDLQPDDAEGWANLGLLLQDEGEGNEAEEALTRALTLNADMPHALVALGMLMLRRRRDEEAEPLLRRALMLQPGLPRAHRGLGEILLRQGDLGRAEHCLKMELAVQPDDLEVKNLLGQVFHRQGRLGDAAKVFTHVTEQNENFADAFNNLGLVLQHGGHEPAAESAFRRVTELRPDSAEAFNNLGNALQAQGRFIEAQSCFRRALALRPSFHVAHSNLLGAMNECESMTPQMCLTEARRFGERLTLDAGEPYVSWLCEPAPARLRLGLVSGDFRRHPVTYFTLAWLRALDRSRIEVIGYPTNDHRDDMTDAVRALCDQWVPVRDLDDVVAAERIHADGVHVLIDMAGHTADNRLPVFARRPAPVQVSWPGYFATTGVEQMDWFLADRTCLPENLQHQFTEEICYLPDTRLCFTPPQDASPVSALPMLSTGVPTFASFQKLSKLTDAVLVAWAKVLDAVPSARLRVQSRSLDHKPSQVRLLERMRECGLDTQRVECHGPVQHADYLSAYGEVDVVLDTFPYSGGTTTCEALWMGVPTVTLAGDNLIARQGASLMRAAGLDDWVAGSLDEYVRRAVQAVSDPGALAALRAGLRARVEASALCDGARFAAAMEAALWQMWRGRERSSAAAAGGTQTMDGGDA